MTRGTGKDVMEEGRSVFPWKEEDDGQEEEHEQSGELSALNWA